MKVIVFLGPTLPLERAQEILDADYRAPAAHGDLYRAALERPCAIALIDGYFKWRASVRHKEILWAMAQGIHVFGAGSMGALRAAELAPFGMIGIGRVFDAYQKGLLEDDDEVAVEHGPRELGYQPVSEAMVNIRATLEAAEAAGVISRAVRENLTAISKKMHYGNRDCQALITQAQKLGVQGLGESGLACWLFAHRVDQKAEDATLLLSHLDHFISSNPPSLRAPFDFMRTEAWECDAAAASVIAEGSALLCEELLDEVRLVPGLHTKLREVALARGLALREADRQRINLDEEDGFAAMEVWERQHGLGDPDAVVWWKKENELDGDRLRALVLEDERQRRVAALSEPLIARNLMSALRSSGDFGRLARRAREKRQVLGASTEAARSGEVALSQLIVWYTSRRLGVSEPIDIETLSRVLGFATAERLYNALAKEYKYLSAVRANMI